MSETLSMKVLSADHIEMRDACYKDMTRLIKKCADDAEAIPVTSREALLTLLEAIESNGATGFGLVGTPAASIEARLARGERGIPKIPDSPNTRHAQAQPPWMMLPPHPAHGQQPPHRQNHWCARAGCRPACSSEIAAAARPAEQPAPRSLKGKLPPLDLDYKAEQPSAPPLLHLANCPPESTVDASYNHGEPSAPPQPQWTAAPPYGTAATTTTRQEEVARAAEPSVEARQPEIPFHHISWCKRYESQTCNCGLDEALAAAKREGMEALGEGFDLDVLIEHAERVDQLWATSTACILKRIKAASKEQQNG